MENVQAAGLDKHDEWLPELDCAELVMGAIGQYVDVDKSLG